MNQEVFKILRIGKTLELIMASYQLLAELDKVSNPHVQSLLIEVHFVHVSILLKVLTDTIVFVFGNSLSLVYIWPKQTSCSQALMLYLNWL